MTIEIEKGVPMPRQGYNLPFDAMALGDSFKLPHGLQLAYARQLVRSAQKKLGWKFSIRKLGDGYRCWRVK